MRRAGSGLLSWGGRVIWTVADGARGRRWRATLIDDGAMYGAILLETGSTGRVNRLEVATAAGLLTLHPETAAIHGNVVRCTGVTHVSLPWGEDHILLVSGAPATAGAAAGALQLRLGIGEGRTVTGVLVHPDLVVRPATFRVARVGPRGWHFVVADTGEELGVTLDLDGIPTLVEAEDWPLELEPGS